MMNVDSDGCCYPYLPSDRLEREALRNTIQVTHKTAGHIPTFYGIQRPVWRPIFIGTVVLLHLPSKTASCRMARAGLVRKALGIPIRIFGPHRTSIVNSLTNACSGQG
jgi:hypothetical protein